MNYTHMLVNISFFTSGHVYLKKSIGESHQLLSYPNSIMLTALRTKVQKCTEVGETFECGGPHEAQINCSEYVSLPELL